MRWAWMMQQEVGVDNEVDLDDTGMEKFSPRAWTRAAGVDIKVGVDNKTGGYYDAGVDVSEDEAASR